MPGRRQPRRTLRDTCRQFDVRFSQAGRAIAFAGATLGQFKTNGRAFTYSPLSRVIELEALSSGVLSKLRLWESLILLASVEPQLNLNQLTRHAEDARGQLDLIRRLHDMAAQEAFVDGRRAS